MRSDDIREWLTAWVDAHEAGAALPSPREIAGRFNVSIITVRRVLRDLKRRGVIELVRGSGAYIPGNQKAPLEVPPSQAASESIRLFLLDCIRDSTTGIGHALPSVKYLALRFKVARATVLKGYRALEGNGLVRRVGRTYWIGRGPELLQHGRRKTVQLFYHGNAERVYYDPHLFTGTWMGNAYRKMEHELLLYGYDVKYEDFGILKAQLRKWRRTRAAPAAIIVHRIDTISNRAVLGHIESFLNASRDRAPAVMIDWLRGDLSELPRRVHRISRGNIQTAVARELARQICLRGYRRVVYHFQEEVNEFEWFSRWIRLHNELLAMHADVQFSVAVKLASSSTPDLFYKRFFSTIMTPDELAMKLSKYRDTSERALERLVKFVDDFRECVLDNQTRTAHVVIDDATALEARNFLFRYQRKPSTRSGVVSLENNPRYFPQRISSCVMDWDRTGYFMAHALIGDFFVRKSRKGFLKPAVIFLDRGSL